jgi:hypothetical protein
VEDPVWGDLTRSRVVKRAAAFGASTSFERGLPANRSPPDLTPITDFAVVRRLPVREAPMIRPRPAGFPSPAIEPHNYLYGAGEGPVPTATIFLGLITKFLSESESRIHTQFCSRRNTVSKKT